MIKKILIYIVVILSFFFFIDSVNAYVYVDTTEGQFKPYEATSAIKNPDSLWPNGNNFSSGSPWLRSIGQYWYGSGGLYGYYLNVSADYYFGIETLTTYTLPNFNWFTSTRNTLTADNLRCGIGSYGTGYDSTYAPVVTNFSVTLESGVSSQVNAHDVFHVKFNYSQQLSQTVNMNGSNMSCWFETNPSDGLFGQILANNLNATRYTSYTEKLTYSLSSSPEYSKLQDIEDQLTETNEKLDEIKDMDISDEDKKLPNDDAYQDYTDVEDDLLDKVNEADMDVLDIAIDEDSSNFVWDTLTDLIQSHTLIFGTVIAILSIGIIKLALGR